jgi:predicted metal-dependent phosphoesterase TrpH
VLSPAALVARARDVGLDRIAVTDHNAIDGAREASAIDPARVIIGEEIDTQEGTHLIGLFLHEAIPAGEPVRRTADLIREQGGVVYAPHPFAYLTSSARHALEALAVADVVEVFNARAFLPSWNRHALAAARANGLPTAAGSDGHFAREIGSAWTELPAFNSADDLRRSLVDARPVARWSQSPLIHVVSTGIQMGKALADIARGSRVRPRTP